ncbi:lymphokine-activated killer T-cell-originated protein kinase [Cylas formicarius]|uniref:lymphokine-activated killer T-cell-originated protein kinase n=1 Tax=Cylas formicarius TaxID=197179 RepID=UPI0029589E6E|nr:lymphokine-activated killer T-cell-originated protein kinase [Cylas formicarius]
MESVHVTPERQTGKNKLKIPPSPFLKRIGFGTGVAVYELERSPAFNNVLSPWAIKKLIKRKSLNIDLQNRLKNEAEILRSLKHPNIVGFRAFLEQPNGHILAMEECISSVGDLIEQRCEEDLGPFPAQIIRKVSTDLSRGLNYLHHDALLIHCDVKSYNILTTGYFGICKLCDFGVCLPVTREGSLDTAKVGEDAEYIGTTSWCAPEVLLYPQIITTKADIYSFGLVIWEMIALCPPIQNELANNISQVSNSDSEIEEILDNSMHNRMRPAIPDNVVLGPEYSDILGVFYCCTDAQKELRPTAGNLVKILEI